MQKLVSVSDTSGHVDELFSSQIASDRKSNRENLLLILRSIKFLGRQGILLRGASQEGRGEVDGKFLQLYFYLFYLKNNIVFFCPAQLSACR